MDIYIESKLKHDDEYSGANVGAATTNGVDYYRVS